MCYGLWRTERDSMASVKAPVSWCQGRASSFLLILLYFYFYFILFTFSGFTLQVLYIYIMTSDFLFLWASWVFERVGSLCLFMSFPLSSFPLLLCFFLFRCVSSYFILFHSYLLGICLFSSEGQKWGEPKCEWDWGGVGRVERCSTIIRIHCGGKSAFSIKEKRKQRKKEG